MILTLDYKSLSDDELQHVLSNAGAELLARRRANAQPHSDQHVYRISMTRTPNKEPKAFRFTKIEDTVVQIPLVFDQIIGKTGKVIGGEFLLMDGDVVQKIAASGLTTYLIPWQGITADRDLDIDKVLEGDSESETLAKIQAYVLGDRSLLVEELTNTIAFLQESIEQYDEKGITEEYWGQVADNCRLQLKRLQPMLMWAQSTSQVIVRSNASASI